MRTTLSLDDDVLAAARERARRQHRSIGAVISELARAALTGRLEPQPAAMDALHGFEPLPHRGAAVTNTLIDQLREDEPE